MAVYSTDDRFAMVPPEIGGDLEELERYVHGSQEPEEVAPGLYYDRSSGKFIRKEEEIAQAMAAASPQAPAPPERPAEPASPYGEPEPEKPKRLFERPDQIPTVDEPLNTDVLPEARGKMTPAPEYGEHYYYNEDGELFFDGGLNTEQMQRIMLQVDAGTKELASGMLAGVGATLKQAAEDAVTAELEGTGDPMTDAMLSAGDVIAGRKATKKELEQRYGHARKAGEELIKAAQADVWNEDPRLRAKNDSAMMTYAEDFLRMTPQVVGQIATTMALGPVGGGLYIGNYIMGSSYLQYRKEGVEHDRALGAAFANAVMQVPLESFGMSRMTKYFHLRKKAYKNIKKLAEDLGTEWFTEFSQGVPDLMATVFAKGADKTQLEMVNQFTEQLGGALKQSAYEGLLTAPWALIGAGGQRMQRSRTVHKLKKAGFTDQDIQWLDDHPDSTPLDLVNIKFQEEGQDITNAILVNQLGKDDNVAQRTQEDLWAGGYPVPTVHGNQVTNAMEEGMLEQDADQLGEQDEAALRYEEELAAQEAQNESARIVQDGYEFFKAYNESILESPPPELIPGGEAPEIVAGEPAVTEEVQEGPVIEEEARPIKWQRGPGGEYVAKYHGYSIGIEKVGGKFRPYLETGFVQGFPKNKKFGSLEEAKEASISALEGVSPMSMEELVARREGQATGQGMPRIPEQIGLFEMPAEELAKQPKKVRKRTVELQGQLTEKTLQAAGKTAKPVQEGLFSAVQSKQKRAKKASRIDFLREEAMKLPENARKAVLKHLDTLESEKSTEPKLLYEGPPHYQWLPKAVKRGMLLKPWQVTKSKFKELFPTLEKVSEQIYESGEKMKVAMVNVETGQIYAYDIGEGGVWNHADIFIKHELPAETSATGFVDPEGTFYYQYPESAHEAYIHSAWKQGEDIPYKVLEEYGKLKKAPPVKDVDEALEDVVDKSADELNQKFNFFDDRNGLERDLTPAERKRWIAAQKQELDDYKDWDGWAKVPEKSKKRKAIIRALEKKHGVKFHKKIRSDTGNFYWYFTFTRGDLRGSMFSINDENNLNDDWIDFAKTDAINQINEFIYGIDLLKKTEKQEIKDFRKGVATGRIRPGDSTWVATVEKYGGKIGAYAIRHTANFEVGNLTEYGDYDPDKGHYSRQVTKKHPVLGLHKIIEYFTGKEKEVEVTDSKTGKKTKVKKKIKLIRGTILPTNKEARDQKIDEVFKKYKDKARWYFEWHDWMNNLLKDDNVSLKMAKFIKIQAILSANRNPQTNQGAFKVVVDRLERYGFVRGGPNKDGVSDEDASKINDIWDGKDKAVDTLKKRMDTYGAKIGSYMHTGLDPRNLESVVIDRHMGRLWGYHFGLTKDGHKAGSFTVDDLARAEITQDILEAAKRNGVTPGEVQAALWFEARPQDGALESYLEAVWSDPSKYLPTSLFKLLFAEPETMVRWLPTATEKMTVGGMMFPSQHNAQERDARISARTKLNPFIDWTNWYGAAAQPESFVIGRVPHTAKFEAGTIYDFGRDRLGLWNAAVMAVKHDPQAADGDRYAMQNAFARLVQQAGFKGFSTDKGDGEKWYHVFEPVKVQPGKKFTMALSDVVENVVEVPQDIAALENLTEQKAPQLWRDVQDIIRNRNLPITLNVGHGTIANFDVMTAGQMEYGLNVDVSGPELAIRALAAEIGARYSQSAVMILDHTGKSNGTRVQFMVQKDITADQLTEEFKKAGLTQFNIKKKVLGTAVDMFVKKNDKAAVKKLHALYEKIGKRGTLQDDECKMEMVGSEDFDRVEATQNYAKDMANFFGKTKGLKFYEEAANAGHKYAALESIHPDRGLGAAAIEELRFEKGATLRGSKPVSKRKPKKPKAQRTIFEGEGEIKPDVAFDANGHIDPAKSKPRKAISAKAKVVMREITRRRDAELKKFNKGIKTIPPKLTNMEKLFLVRTKEGLKQFFGGSKPNLKPQDLKVYRDEDMNENHKIAREIFRRLGTEVVFFEFNGMPELNSMYGGLHDHGIDQFDRVCFVNAQNVGKSLVQVAGHEWFHGLEKWDYALWKEFRDFVMAFHPDVMAYEKGAKARFDDEFFSDIVGEIMGREDFWNALYAYDPVMHTTLWQRLYQAISRCIGAIRSMIRDYDAMPAKMQDAGIKGRKQDAIQYLKKQEKAYERLRDKLLETVEQWREVDWWTPAEQAFEMGELYSDFADRSIDMHFNMKQVELDDPEYKKFMGKIGRKDEPLGKRLGEKMRDLRKTWKKKALDKYLVYKEKLDDPLGITDTDKMVYTYGRMESNLQSTLHAFWEHGDIGWDPDSPSPILNSMEHKGIKPLMKKMGQHRELFFHWLVANRAEKLMEGGRERLFTKDEIKAIQAGVVKLGLSKQFKEWRAEYDAIKESILKFAEQAGIISDKIRLVHDTADYIPFMRVLDDKFDGEMFWAADEKRVKRFIDNKIKRLRGGKENLGDPIENIFENWTYLIKESIKNRTRVKALDRMLQLKLANPVQIATEKIAWEELTEDEKKVIMNWYNQRGVIGAMKDGEKYFVMVHDTELYDTIAGMDYKMLDNWVFNMMSGMKRMLTYGVTFAPAFKIANTIRDTMSAFVTQKGFKPMFDTARGFWHIMKKDNWYWEAMSSGALFSQGYVRSDDPKAMARYIRREVGSVKDLPMYNPVNWVRMLLNAWEAVGDATENAARLQDYVNMRNAGATRFSAGYSAKDLLDFTSSGQSEVVQALIRMIPFLNARMQGLYKLGRAYGDNKRGFTAKGLILMSLTLALWMYNKDDDRYNELPKHERYMYYHFWIGDVHFRIPKPFEVGAVFSTWPEEFVGNFYKQQTGQSTMQDATKDMLDFVFSTVRDTFAFNPTPQFVKPIGEAMLNFDMFRWAPIEGMELQGRSPEYRYKRYTSETMKRIGEATGLSPVRLEHVLRGYTGELGMYALGASDILFNNLNDHEDPEPRIQDREFVGKVLGRFIRTGPQRSVEYVEKLYGLVEDSNQMTRDLNVFKEVGEIDKAREMAQDKRWLYANRKHILRIQKYLRNYNDRVEKIYNSNMTPEKKRERLDKLAEQRNEVTKKYWLAIVESRRKG